MSNTSPKPPPLGMWLLLVVCGLVIGEALNPALGAAAEWAAVIGGVIALGAVSRWAGRATRFMVTEFLIGVREGMAEARAKRAAPRTPRP
jgi:hypothetical protein